MTESTVSESVLLTVYQNMCLVFPCDILFWEDCTILCCLFQDKDFPLQLDVYRIKCENEREFKMADIGHKLAKKRGQYLAINLVNK